MSITCMPPSELRNASAGGAAELVVKLVGAVPELPWNVDTGPVPGMIADGGGELYPLLGVAWPVAGGGTRVAPLIGPTGNSGALAVPAVPAGAYGPVAIEPPIERWQPANNRQVNGVTNSNSVFAGQVMAGLFQSGEYSRLSMFLKPPRDK
jgi:hypothetical protein